MLISSFMVSVVQNTLAVFVPTLAKPFNAWSKQAYAQGFTWRPQSVSFLVFDDEEIYVEVHIEKEVCLRDDAIRSILVPFKVPKQGLVEISGIYEENYSIVQIPEGEYALVFQLGYKGVNELNSNIGQREKNTWCVLSFIRNKSTKPLILKQDTELNPPKVLVMDGRPA